MTRWIALTALAIAALPACRSATMAVPEDPPPPRAEVAQPATEVAQPAAETQPAAPAPPIEQAPRTAPTAAQLDSVGQTVRAVLARQLRRSTEEIGLAARIEADLGMNAYDQAMMRLELEEYYSIVLPSQGLDTVAELVSFIAREMP